MAALVNTTEQHAQ